MNKWNKTGPTILAIMETAKTEDCILWPHGRDGQGYARAKMPGFSTRLAHRIICEMRHGAPTLDDAVAMHSCGNGHLGCVNPAHLSWGTVAENNKDKERHGTKPLGVRTGKAKLTPTSVRVIRNLHVEGQTQKQIAAAVGVHHTTVQAVIEGRTWGHVQ